MVLQHHFHFDKINVTKSNRYWSSFSATIYFPEESVIEFKNTFYSKFSQPPSENQFQSSLRQLLET